MLIPFFYNKVFILFGKLLCFIEILYFKSLRLPQLHFSLDIKNGFSSRLADMDMNRAVIIAVESKTKSVIFSKTKGISLVLTDKDKSAIMFFRDGFVK